MVGNRTPAALSIFRYSRMIAEIPSRFLPVSSRTLWRWIERGRKSSSSGTVPAASDAGGGAARAQGEEANKPVCTIPIGQAVVDRRDVKLVLHDREAALDIGQVLVLGNKLLWSEIAHVQDEHQLAVQLEIDPVRTSPLSAERVANDPT